MRVVTLHRDDLTPGGGLELLSNAPNPWAEVRERAGTADRAHLRPRVPTGGTGQTALIADTERRLADLAAKHHRTSSAGESPGTSGDVHDAYHRAGRVAEFRDELRAEEGAPPRLYIASIVNNDPRPAATLPIRRRMFERPSLDRLHRWHRRHQEHGHAESSATFERDLAGVLERQAGEGT